MPMYSTSHALKLRMDAMARKPFRKIRVKDHLGPGYKPTSLACLQASRIVADELTVRLGKRCQEIANLPYGAGELPFAKRVISWYSQTCQDLFEFTDQVEALRRETPPPLTSGKRATALGNWLEMPSLRGGYSSLFPSFGGGNSSTPSTTILETELAPPSEDLDRIIFGTECKDPLLAPKATQLTNQLFHILERAVARHKPVVLLTAQEVNKGTFKDRMDPLQVQQFLTRFHHQRIAVRLLIGHSVALSRPLPLDNMIGIFCTKTPIEDIVLESLQLAEEMCLITYGCVPPVELSCTPRSASGKLLYIPSHLQHIMFELLKNAMRAVIEKEQLRIGEKNGGIVNTAALPPIVVHWDLNDEHCLFEVRDLGSGIPDQILDNVFLFHYTTAKPPTEQVNVMAGYGYGLPLSRLYARFLKGDIWLETKEGQGTNVFVQCKVNWSPDELI